MSSSTSQPPRGGVLRARRNPRLMWAGLLAICLGGLGAAVLYVSVAGTQSVVAVTRTVYRDQVITAEDLGVISLATVPGLETVPADQLPVVVGSTALVDLVGGSVLSPRAWGSAEVEAGQVRLGLKLAPGHRPSTAMPPGTSVLLVAVAREGDEATPGASVTGRVASLPSDLPDGSVVLDVSVPAAEAERLARLAAADLLVVVRRTEAER